MRTKAQWRRTAWGSLLVIPCLWGPLTVTAQTAPSAPSAADTLHIDVAPQLDVPFVPTPEPIVEGMLTAAGVTKDDRLVDLGSGDGRIVVTAAQRYGTRGVGIDLNPERIREANANAKRAGVEELVEFREGDLFDADLSEATVVTLYLLPDINERLKPKLLSELAPGTRIVSHAFDMGDWKPEKTVEVGGTEVYLWVVPEREASARPAP